MLKKSECKKAIRHLTHRWAAETGLGPASGEISSFSAFKAWLLEIGHSQYLSFRSKGDPDYDAEMWFDQELKQTWRN
ncbi:hypothetical protein [Labrys wisconsinensis]|uniref:Uncharacterized protein n=1 Tax=Labrys wisconsinensis TaxID=425677 RepID=A0ABU0JEE1_9HYPH|nr:hypothetical protein [Labrys wisconsinensis]MDQ0472646.1 hypothetical protein [Labrys wisconsinensis]